MHSVNCGITLFKAHHCVYRTSRKKLGAQKKELPPFRAKSATLPSSTSPSALKKTKSPKQQKEKQSSPPSKKKSRKDGGGGGEGSPKPSPPLKRKEERKSSFSKMHEKLRRRLSRGGARSKVPEARERPSARYWSSTPGTRHLEATGDPNTLTCLARSSSMRHGPSKTVSAQFQASLVSLMERLEQTNPFFVRCIKSNGEKVCSSLNNAHQIKIIIPSIACVYRN